MNDWKSLLLSFLFNTLAFMDGKVPETKFRGSSKVAVTAKGTAIPQAPSGLALPPPEASLLMTPNQPDTRSGPSGRAHSSDSAVLSSYASPPPGGPFLSNPQATLTQSPHASMVRPLRGKSR